MCGPDIPDPPNPFETANAQTGANISTATANTILGNANQITPDYSLEYKRSGGQFVYDPNKGVDKDGKPIGGKRWVPKFTATTTLSDSAQQLKDAGDSAKLNMANFASDQTGRLSDLLGKPIDINNEATEARLYDLGAKRLDPRFQRERADLETQLANKGIGVGSEAYSREMEMASQGRNDAYNSLLLSGRGQAIQEALTERNQPINEITALLSGSQVSQPQFAGFNAGGIANTDVAGLINQEYQQRAAKAQAQGSFTQSLLGGLFGAGATLGGAYLGAPR